MHADSTFNTTNSTKQNAEIKDRQNIVFEMKRGDAFDIILQYEKREFKLRVHTYVAVSYGTAGNSTRDHVDRAARCFHVSVKIYI